MNSPDFEKILEGYEIEKVNPFLKDDSTLRFVFTNEEGGVIVLIWDMIHAIWFMDKYPSIMSLADSEIAKLPDNKHTRFMTDLAKYGTATMKIDED